MLIVKKAKPEQFERFAKIFSEEFDSSLPEPDNSEILIAYENGVMKGFVLVEEVKLVGQIYVVPDERKSSSEIVKSLITFVKKTIAPKSVVGAVASERRFEHLYKAFGMQKIEGIFYRKNL